MKKTLTLLFITIILTSCATVPKATVEASVMLEKELIALKESNKALINSIYDEKEQNCIEYLDSTYLPHYINTLFNESSVQKLCNEVMINPEKRLNDILFINKGIQNEYIKTKELYLTPIQEERKNILKAYNDEYEKAIKLNNDIKANIASAALINETYKNLASKIIDTHKLDSTINKSIYYISNKVDSAESKCNNLKEKEELIKTIIKK